MRRPFQRSAAAATTPCWRAPGSRSGRGVKPSAISAVCAVPSAQRPCRCTNSVAPASTRRRWWTSGAGSSAACSTMPPDAVALDALLHQRLVVCVGAGGVGKTTTAAALAVAGALRGRATAVITVDPSRRLKDALGLAELSSEPCPVALGDGAGRLDALALDTKRTFDRLITRVAASPGAAERIFANRLYRELSSELGG